MEKTGPRSFGSCMEWGKHHGQSIHQRKQGHLPADPGESETDLGGRQWAVSDHVSRADWEDWKWALHAPYRKIDSTKGFHTRVTRFVWEEDHIFNHPSPKIFFPNIGSLEEGYLYKRGVIKYTCDNCFMCIHSETPYKTLLYRLSAYQHNTTALSLCYHVTIMKGNMIIDWHTPKSEIFCR